MRTLAIALLALASCRTESRPPLGEAVAEASTPPRETPRDAPRETPRETPRDASRETKDDRTDELPPSLFEANKGQKKDKKEKAPPNEEPPPKEPPPKEPAMKPSRIVPIKAALCVTTGAATIGGKIEKPAMRAVAKGTDGEAAAMTFTFIGDTVEQKKLSSGELRRQLGLKLRAENGCNLIYVMWRLDPKPSIVAQMKRNPGAKDHKACGTGGYKWLKASEQNTPPELKLGDKYTLRAEIENEELKVFIDDTLYWQGALPEAVRDLRGPAGIRSDNLAYDLVSFDAASASADHGNAKCVAEDKD